MRKLVLVVCALACAMSLFALSADAKVLPLSSSVYEYVDVVYSLAGLPSPSGTRPWTAGEARFILDRVDRSDLPQAAQVLFDMASEEIDCNLRWDFGQDAQLGADLRLSPEIYAHTNGEDFVSDDDWVYTFEDRTHFVIADMEMSVGTFFYSFCDMMYGLGRYGLWDVQNGNIIKVQDDPVLSEMGYIGAMPIPSDSSTYMALSSRYFTNGFTFNFPEKSAEFDFIWPKRAIVSLAGQSWSFVFGRDRIGWGNSNIGNFLVDDHVDYNDFLSARFFSDRFKYDFLIVFVDDDLRCGERQTNSVKMLLAHRLEFRFKSVTASVSENVMYKTSEVALQYLNPAVIYHNINNRGMFNAIAVGDVDWTVTKGLNLYLQFALDQATAPNEASNQAPASGLLVGAEYTAPAMGGILTSSLEAAYSSPMMYRRDEVDFLMLRKYFCLGNVSYVSDVDFLGFPYGGDALVLDFRSKLVKPGLADFTIDVRAAFHGEMDAFTSHNRNGNNDDLPNVFMGKTILGLGFYGRYMSQTFSASFRTDSDLGNFVDFEYPKKVTGFAQLDLVLRQTVDRQMGNTLCGDSVFDCQFSAGIFVTL